MKILFKLKNMFIDDNLGLTQEEILINRLSYIGLTKSQMDVFFDENNIEFNDDTKEIITIKEKFIIYKVNIKYHFLKYKNYVKSNLFLFILFIFVLIIFLKH